MHANLWRIALRTFDHKVTGYIMETSWKNAIVRVLLEAEEPLHYAEISERILTEGYYSTEGATPAATVNAQIASSIKHQPDKTPFQRVGKGIFSLKNKSDIAAAKPLKPASAEKPNANLENEDSQTDSIIHSFGMYWQRELVVWRNTPKLFGKQQATAKAVDFSGQKGIYILYDHHTIVYVGRSVDRPLGRRLYEHTTDRLSSRWNRFSWFGLSGVTEAGDLNEVTLNPSSAGIISTLEALLIETLEPPQNRKRGDDFSANEFIQDVDIELKEKEIQNTLRALEQKLRT